MADSTRHLVLLVIAAAVLFSVNMGGYDLWPADEPRFGQVAREMLQGGDYLVPRVNGEKYLEKPPLFFWLIAAFSLPQGDVTEFSARLPSLLSAIAVVALTYLLAAQMLGPRVAFWAALVLITSYRFWWQARTAQIDMLLTACMTTALYALWRWEQVRQGRWLVVLYAAMAAGMLAKGPPALVFPLLFLYTFYWRNREARRQTHWLLGTLAATAVTMAWFIPARLAVAGEAASVPESDIAGNLLRNTLGRFLLGVSKLQPPWYYAIELPMDFLPWALFLPWVLVWVWRNRRANQPLTFLWCWVVPALIFFSISLGKRAVYLLPLHPAIAILIAAAVLSLVDEGRESWLRWTLRVWAGALAAIALLPVGALAAGYGDQLTPGLIAIAGAAACGAAAVAVYAARGSARLAPALIAGPMSMLLLLAALYVFPAVNPHKSAREICGPVRTLAEQGGEFRLYSLGFSREEYIFYSKHFHTPVLTSLVGMESVDAADFAAAARTQIDARKRLARAVEAVPIRDMEAISEEERVALLEVLEQASAGTDASAAELRQLEDALRAELDRFAAEFTAAEPAFLFVQDEDWRLLYPLYSEAPRYTVVRHQPVGRRHVLLLANAAGSALLENAESGAIR